MQVMSMFYHIIFTFMSIVVGDEHFASVVNLLPSSQT